MASSTLSSGRINLENFTDRILPRREFWKHYRELEAELAPDVPSRVLMYHGIGGIGKTTLLAKLKQELEEDRKNNKLPAPVYAEYSFQSPDRDSRTVLRQLCADLQRRGNFVFPHFAYGLYHYATKRGEPADSPDVKGLFDQIPILNDVFEAIDMVPGVGILPKVFKTADTDIAKLRSWLQSRKGEFRQIEDLDTDSLYAELPLLFAQDMQLNINRRISSKKKFSPVVIFLDTYEELVNDQRTSAESDTWIRGELGLVRNIPGVLWVLAGRNTLKWQAFDPYWTPQPPHYLLGTLSDEDSAAYLNKEGVQDTALQRQLYKLTNGTPLFLDICVRQYRALVRQSKTPDISMFGQSPEELIYRFVRNMSDTQKDIVYMLSALQNWTEALLNDLAPVILRSYSDSAYYSVLEQSFIQYTEDMHYHIHKTMGEVLQNTPPGKIIGKRTGKALLEHFAPSLKNTSYFSQEFSQALLYSTRGALLFHGEREAFRTYFQQELLSCLTDILEIGYSHQVLTTLDTVETYASRQKDDLLYALWMRLNAIYARKQNNTTDALTCSEISLKLYRTLLQDNDPEILTAMHHRAVALNFAGEYHEALSMAEDALNKRRVVLGREALDTLLTKSLVAQIKNNLGQSEEALAIQKETLEQLHRVQGDKDSVITDIQSNMAETYDKMGLHEEAFVVRQDVWKKQSDAYGEDDPRTLLSMDNLADTAARLGQHDAAIAIKELVVEKYRSTRGEDDPETINAQMDLEAMRNEANLHPELTDLKQADESYTAGVAGSNITPDDKSRLGETGNGETMSAVPHTDTFSAIDKISSSFGISEEKRNAIISGDAAKFRAADTAVTPKYAPEPEAEVQNEVPIAPAATETPAAKTETPAPKAEAPTQPAPVAAEPAAAQPEEKKPADLLASLSALMAGKKSETPEPEQAAATAETTQPPAAQPEAPTQPAPVAAEPAAAQPEEKKPADLLASLSALMAGKKPETPEPEQAAATTETTQPPAKAETAQPPAAKAPAPKAETPAPKAEAPAPKAEKPGNLLASLSAMMAGRKPATPEQAQAPATAETTQPPAKAETAQPPAAKAPAPKAETPAPKAETPAPKAEAPLAPAVKAAPRSGETREKNSLAVLKNALDYRMRIFGKKAPDTRKAMADLAKGYCEAGQHQDAKPLLERLLALQKEEPGAAQTDILATMQLLEGCLTALGDTHGAISLKMQIQMLRSTSGGATT